MQKRQRVSLDIQYNSDRMADPQDWDWGSTLPGAKLIDASAPEPLFTKDQRDRIVSSLVDATDPLSFIMSAPDLYGHDVVQATKERIYELQDALVAISKDEPWPWYDYRDVIVGALAATYENIDRLYQEALANFDTADADEYSAEKEALRELLDLLE